MFHQRRWQLEYTNGRTILSNDLFGIEVQYIGEKKSSWSTNKKGTWFLFPYIDDNHKTIVYFAFDTLDQKVVFEQMVKISGIGPKTAFAIAAIDKKELQKAIDTFDVKAIQKIPGVWPKTAKRLLVELKASLRPTDLQKLDIDEKLFKSIVTTMKNMGRDATSVRKKLAECPVPLEKDNLQEIIKWLIGQI